MTDTTGALPRQDSPDSGIADAPPCTIAVDLDGTLLRTDLLWEGMAAAMTRAPLLFLLAPFIVLLRGRPALKRMLAARGLVDISQLPLRQPFVDWLVQQRARGRRLIMITAADQKAAEAVAQRLNLFDAVYGSSDGVNLKGVRKLDVLRREAPEGFAYAGDTAADLPIWRGAQSAIVARRASLAEALAADGPPVEAVFAEDRPPARAFLRAMRLHQWAKNLLIFAPILLTHRYADLSAWAACALGFLIVGVMASSTYVLNDLSDLAADRAHWSKRLRPFASGALPISWGLALAPLGVVASLGCAYALSVGFGITLTVYLALTLAYSQGLKRLAMIDTLVLASLFTLRLLLGLALLSATPTPWLLGFSMMLFLSLSLAKRHAEVLRKRESGGGALQGRGYAAEDADLTLAMGVATGVAAILILMLYVAEEAFAVPFARPQWLWALPAIIYLWVSRIWLLCHRGQLHDDPVLFAVKDPISIGFGTVAVAAFIVAAV